MAKTLAIPSHIVTSGDADHYYNLVLSTAIGDISRSSNNIVVSNNTLNDIKAALGLSANDIQTLSRSSAINLSSYYRPNKAAPDTFDEFVGYNHYAKPATYIAAKYTETQDLNITSDGKINFSVTMRRGERLPMESSAGYWSGMKVKFELLNNSTLAVLQTVEVADVDVDTMRNSTTVSCQFIGISNATTLYKVKVSSYYMLNEVDTQLIEDGTYTENINAIRYTAANLIAVRHLNLWPNTGVNVQFSFNHFKNSTGTTINAASWSGNVTLRYSYVNIDVYDHFGVSAISELLPEEERDVTFTLNGEVLTALSDARIRIYQGSGYGGTLLYDSNS